MKPIRAATLCLLLLTFAILTHAQATFDTTHTAATAQNPPGLTCTLRLVGGRTTFHQGEIIPVELDFTSNKPGQYNLNWFVTERMTMDLFHASPAEGVTALRTSFETSGTFSGNLPKPAQITSQPSAVQLTLNSWLRFDRPGVYRIYATSVRVLDGGAEHTFRVTGLNKPVASNIISLTILPPDPAWSHAQVVSATNAMHPTRLSPPSMSDPLEVLRYLDTQESVKALLAILADDTYPPDATPTSSICQDGLYEYPDQKWLYTEMKRDLAAPNYAITQTFLNTLSPMIANQQKDNNYGRAKLTTWNLAAEAAPKKTVTALPMTLYSLVQEDLINRTIGYNPGAQKRLVNPALLPVLRRAWAAAVWTDRETTLNDFILRRLYELSPKEGRALILKEAASPKPRASISVLGMLPDKTVPALNAPLAANLVNDRADGEAVCDLIARYATAAIFPQVKSAYHGSPDAWSCAPQAAMLAYFLRVKPAYGVAMVNAALKQRTQTACYTSLFTEIAPMRFGARLEKIAEQHLYDPDRDIISNAAEALGKYGSPSSEAALWARLRKPDGNAKIRAAYEYRVAEALATAKNWYMGHVQLEKIYAICVMDNVSSELARYIGDSKSPSVHIDYEALSDEGWWTIGQYRGNGSATFFAKLAQFPRGTEFSWQDISFGLGEERLFKKATAVAKARGLSVKRWHPEAKK